MLVEEVGGKRYVLRHVPIKKVSRDTFLVFMPPPEKEVPSYLRYRGFKRGTYCILASVLSILRDFDDFYPAVKYWEWRDRVQRARIRAKEDQIKELKAQVALHLQRAN